MHTYSELMTVRGYETGSGNGARIQTLCNFMEEAAGKHADSLGFGLEALREKNLTWVLAKMRIRFHNLPRSGDAVSVETWPVMMAGLQFRRDFLFRVRDGGVPARAATQWVIINTVSRRPERMPDGMVRLLPESPRHALEDADIRVPPVGEEGVSGPTFRIRLADIDGNRHVNNVRYVDFLLEAAAVFGAPGDIPCGLDMQFKTESLWGDTIDCVTQNDPGTPGALLHSLRRDGQEIVRARTLWM